jgi:hypothetical protein
MGKGAMNRGLFVGWLLTAAAQGLGFADPPAAAANQTQGAAGETSGERVGNYCDPKRIRFEGARTFKAETLRLGLEETSDFYDVSHPFAPLADYLAAIETRTRMGYQHGGFPEATVTVDRDEIATQIVVKVQEGPRYSCGPIRITGLKSIDPKLLARRLSTPAELGKKERSALVLETGENGQEKETTKSDDGAWENYLWTPGEPAHLSEVSLRTLGIMVSNVFWEFGYGRPRFAIRATPQPKTHLAELDVEVQDEGPRSIIDRLEVSGLQKNSRESLLKYLKLKPGMALSSNLISRVESKLWNAARFLHYEVGAGRPDERGRAVVKIQVLEYADAPPLDQEFSPAEKAMLRARQWWASPEPVRGGMIFKGGVSNWQGLSFALGVSVRKGLALALRDGSNGAAGSDWGMVLATNLVGLYPPEGRPELAIPDFHGRLTLRLALTGTTNPEQPFNLTFAASFDPTNDSPAAPCQFHLTMAPVALVSLAHKKGWTNHVEGGKWVASSADCRVEVDERTGRFGVRGGPGTNGFVYRWDFAPKAFEETEARLLTGLTHQTNRYDAAKPLGSFAAFAVEELLRSRLLQDRVLTDLTGESRIHAAKVTSALLSKVAVSPLDRLMQGQDQSPDEETFVVPEVRSLTRTGKADILAQVGRWVLRIGEKGFPVGSWPWTLVREGTFLVQGRGRYSAEALQQIYESDDTGPLGYLATAELLHRLGAPTAKLFAARGLAELSETAFARDAKLLFNEDTLVGQSLISLAETLRDMGDADLEYLASLMPPARAELIRQSVALMRAAKGRPTDEVLAPALGAYWRSELRIEVAAALGSLAHEN